MQGEDMPGKGPESPFPWDGLLREVEEQHRVYLGIVERCQAGDASAPAAELMAEMLDHLTAHFHTEEVLMIEIDFPGYQRHQAEHAAIAQAGFDLAARCSDGLSMADVVAFAETWMSPHLGGTDPAIAAFLETASGFDSRGPAGAI